MPAFDPSGSCWNYSSTAAFVWETKSGFKVKLCKECYLQWRANPRDPAFVPRKVTPILLLPPGPYVMSTEELPISNVGYITR